MAMYYIEMGNDYQRTRDLTADELDKAVNTIHDLFEGRYTVSVYVVGQ